MALQRRVRALYTSARALDTAPLFSLRDAYIPRMSTSSGQNGGLRWTIRDDPAECWAIVGPSSETGGAVRRSITDLLLGKTRTHCISTGKLHPPVHPFLNGASPQQSITHVAFQTRTNTSGEFIDYTTRYGAIREDDCETLLESLLASMGVYTGHIAKKRMQPDPLAPFDSDDGRGVGLFKWPSTEAHLQAAAKARAAKQAIYAIAPQLAIDEALLARPSVALSNGQTRRARILRALLSGAQVVVLAEPFTGLDPATRHDVTKLFARLHANKAPRLCLLLREQDHIPDFVTHLVKIDEDGRVVLGPKDTVGPSRAAEHVPGSYDCVKDNHAQRIGVGDASKPAYAHLQDVSIDYGGEPVLAHISLAVHPGTRMVLVGDNGSGKTTLLSLLLGDHPRSYALDEDRLSLFGAARSAASNAHLFLQRRIGHLSPELYNAFPRKGLEVDGLRVAEVVESGYDGIFTRRPRSAAEKRRARHLLSVFCDVLVPSQGEFADEEALAKASFSTSLSHGSQALVLFLRALVHRPLLLVLDEPFQGMSARQAARARAYLDACSDSAWCFYGMDAAEIEQDKAWRQALALVTVSHYEAEWPRSCGALLRLEKGVAVEQW
ncbi:hypothetical protein MVES1_000160 [Malassezia vespertilionis]|uniref:uncharacterized protein n=1 Tax=Malassezia vespertilionis TaxID=2020962 RepID=UPI0024B0ABF1|nr:uncharacterized protein MVES1_000160 [Malassezia vespertilionis]WFD04836.1 hypothetical protein MVES1_000160 [Malassezia vespertilionis]